MKKQVRTKEGRDLPAVHLLFSNLKRVIKGVHTHVSPQKLQKYPDLFEYRYNWRDDLFGGVYVAAIQLPLIGPRRYQELKTTATGPAYILTTAPPASYQFEPFVHERANRRVSLLHEIHRYPKRDIGGR